MTEQSPKRAKMASVLDQLKDVTVVVADTGDFEGNSIRQRERLSEAAQAVALSPNSSTILFTLLFLLSLAPFY